MFQCDNVTPNIREPWTCKYIVKLFNSQGTLSNYIRSNGQMVSAIHQKNCESLHYINKHENMTLHGPDFQY